MVYSGDGRQLKETESSPSVLDAFSLPSGLSQGAVSNTRLPCGLLSMCGDEAGGREVEGGRGVGCEEL